MRRKGSVVRQRPSLLRQPDVKWDTLFIGAAGNLDVTEYQGKKGSFSVDAILYKYLKSKSEGGENSRGGWECWNKTSSSNRFPNLKIWKEKKPKIFKYVRQKVVENSRIPFYT